jgi:hypothetical protein
METWSKVVAAVKGVKADAPATWKRDAAYQQQHVMKRWTHVMNGGDDEQVDEQKESA